MKWIPPFTNALAFLGFRDNSSTSNLTPSTDELAFRGVDFGLKLIAAGDSPIVDIVVIHGLDGHWRNTWTAENQVFWIKDLLPDAVPKARIFSYGYDSRTHASSPISNQFIWQHALALVSDLTLHREKTQTERRPLIFIAHSLGGLLVKNALIHSDSTRIGHLVDQKAVKLSTYGINFVGTPHQGGNGVGIGKVLINVVSAVKYTSQNAVQHLAKHSEWLQDLQSRYLAISSDFETVCYYETYDTPLPGYGHMLVVPRYSAVIQGQPNLQEVPLNADHRSMTKFDSPEDENFKRMVRIVNRMVRSAPVKVAENWADWDRKQDVISQSSTKEFNVPFNWHQSQMQVPYFIGRIGTMLQLHEAMTKDVSKALSSPVILFGPGGVGKTQIALEYINRHRKDYSSTIWIDGTSPESVRHSFTNFASQLLDHYDANSLNNTSIYRRLAKVFDDPIIGRSQSEALPLEVERRNSDAKMAGLRDRDKDVRTEPARPLLKFYDHQYITAVQVVLDWLRMAQNKHWLLVYDNFDDIESYDIRDFFPNTHQGSIIITSRRRECARLGLGIEVDQLSQADALELLKKSAKLTDELDEEEGLAASQLLNRLGNLPLAIEQAGAYIYTSSMHISRYLEVYTKNAKGLLENAPIIWNYRNDTVLSTWEISFAAIEKRHPKAASILLLSGFLGRNDLWMELFQWGLDIGANDVQAHDAANNLLSYSLIQPGFSPDSFSIHPMIHLWIQERLPMESRTKLSKKAIELVYQARGAADLAGKLKPFERRVVPHLDAVLKSFQIYHCRAPRTVEATMKPPNISDTWLAGVIEVVCDWFLWSQGIAEDIWYLTLSFVRGNDFARPLWRNLYSLGAIYQHRGLVENAEALYRWTLADAWSRLPRRHPGPLAIVGDLALSIYNQKRLEESLQWYRWALDARSKVLGKTHPATMGAVFGIGLVHEVQGRYDEALELYEIALAGRKKRLGRNDVLTLNVVNSLVGLLQDTMSDEALLWREREVEWKNERSDQTPWQAYADSLEISKSFLVVHQYKKAKEWATKSLALSKLLESNGMVARGLNQVLFDILGDLCYQSSEYEEALQWYTKLLGEIREYCDCDEYAPDEAAKCSQAFHDLGRTSHALGRHKDALDWWLKCMRIEKAHRRWMGPTKAGWLIQLYTVMADSFDKENQPNDALEWRAQAYYLQNEHPKHSIPAYNPAKDQLLYGMAKSLEKLRRWDEAATIWEEILPRMEFTFGCHDQYTKHILSNLMHARFNGARYDEALKHGRQLLIEETYHASDDRPEIYNVIGVLGLIHTHRGQYEEGLYLLTAALEGNQRHLDHDHWIVSVAMYDIALAYWLQKAYDKSFDWIRRAFEADADDHLQCAAKVRDFEGVIDKGLNRDVEELRILCERHLLPKVTQT